MRPEPGDTRLIRPKIRDACPTRPEIRDDFRMPPAEPADAGQMPFDRPVGARCRRVPASA
jgi:hypothetical protein